jgi:molybdopterin/thiamine biosynthesis adenylyltransferase
MQKTALPEIHQWLVTNGFVRDATVTRHYAYDGVIPCNSIEVPVRLSFQELSFQQLPDIHLRDPRPDVLNRPLAHVDHQSKLCYLAEDFYRLDPYDPLQTMVTLLGQAEKVLKGCISGTNAGDVGYEFQSYWKMDATGVVLSTYQSGEMPKYNHLEYTSPTGRTHKQIVVGSEKEIDEYREWRHGKFGYVSHKNVLWVDMSTTALLPESGSWPPSNFKDFYGWINHTDQAAAKTLFKMLGTKPGSQSPILIVLNTLGGFVGIEIILAKGLLSSTNSPGRYRKQLLMDDGHLGTKFIRVGLDNLSLKYQATRNLVTKGLSGKRITLIGCGTIGGYLSRLLVQSGAGQGKGKLTLYDGQIFSSGNIGRHYLDGNYLYENKAVACEHKLIAEYPGVNICAYPENYLDASKIINTDLIIDATGREIFSTFINEQIVKRRLEGGPCPDMLYVWIDGNGYCGRTLFYDGTGGCYRCLLGADGNDRFEPLSSREDLVPVSYQCGESFIPYPPSVSVQAAGMGLEAVLDWASGKPGHHFRHRRFHEKARQHKNQKLKRVMGCPACQR